METGNRLSGMEKPSDFKVSENRNLYFVMNSSSGNKNLSGYSQPSENDLQQKQNRYSFVVDWQVPEVR